MSTAAAFRQHLDACAEEGSLRRLGSSFAHFIATLHDGPTPVPLLLACALLCELEGRGHSCLDLRELADDPCRLLTWPIEQWERLALAAGTLPDCAAAWQHALASCSQVRLAHEDDRHQPLVLDGDRLYLRRYWTDETLVAGAVAARAAKPRDVDPDAVRRWLDQMFDPLVDGGPDWQKIACGVAVRSHFSIVTGGPGTGKTYTVARLLALLFALAEDPERLRIALAAPTGKAATRLKQSIDDALAGLAARLGDSLPLAHLAGRIGAALTLHSLLGARPDTRATRHHAGNPLDVDVLIVDEASMIHLGMMASLLDALPPQAMVILLGDKDQLASVEAGAVLGDLCHRAQEGCYTAATAAYVARACGESIPADMLCGGSELAQQTVMLRKSRRFDGSIGVLAGAVNSGDVEGARRALKGAPSAEVHWLERGRPDDLLRLALEGREAAGGFGAYLSRLKSHPVPGTDFAAHAAWVRDVLHAFDQFRILCAVREGDWGVAGINRMLERALDDEGLLRCRGEWYLGRPVMVTRNDHATGVFNGDVGIALPDPVRGDSLRVWFPHGATVRSVLASRLPHVETAFAMTVHKVQGSEFQHAAMALPPLRNGMLSRELVYTGITRARERFTLVSPEPGIFGDAILKRTRRASGLRARLGDEGVALEN
ncbi:exodeoxyribonuclease V subunit alpha [Noviherbaspirillum pedocola]|uniref:RecBCD enzyme subunit RecD n=1 Tax=Noviherbaspirillum pedocola TaxID=2801341 RepID=A0A934T0E7_9BURK|nr:exodeoxyribonuclease V subunit alpha [Noviherbaspirillum pedocola]MBK4739132.1 exodeoxyribonuclease V subunit alpha [Noviherbaspirillum pedocola]